MTTLTHFFDWVLATSLRASLLTVAVLMIQAAMHRHLSPRWRYAVWLPVLAALLSPFWIESRWSADAFLTSLRPAQNLPVIEMPLAGTGETTPLTPMMSPQAVQSDFELQPYLICIWGLGCVVLLAGGTISFALTLKRYRLQASPPDACLMAEIQHLAEELQLRRLPLVWVCPQAGSPAVTGFWRPALILPSDFGEAFTATERSLVLKHELMHLKRGDLPMNLLLCVLMTLHWFNPLLWLAFHQARIDRETACDDQVLDKGPVELRLHYGYALLKVGSAFSPRGLSMGFVGIFQRGAAMRTRIQALRANRRTEWRTKGTVMALMLLMVPFGAMQGKSFKQTAGGAEVQVALKVFRLSDSSTARFPGKMRVSVVEDGILMYLTPSGYEYFLNDQNEQSGLEVLSDFRVLIKEGQRTEIDMTGKPLIQDDQASLPLGMKCSFTPHVNGKTVILDAHLDYSAQIHSKTGNPADLSSDGLPKIRRWNWKNDIKAPAGDTVLMFVKDDSNGNQLFFAVTTTIVAGAGDASDPSFNSPFTLGQSVFNPGDFISIQSVERDDGSLAVTGEYELASQEHAALGLYITSLGVPPKTIPHGSEQQIPVRKGRGTFSLILPQPYPGLPHVTFYKVAASGKRGAFGGVYFGTSEEAEASKKLDLGYMREVAPK